MIEAIYRVDWIESERGMGQKFSHSSDYDNKETAVSAITKHWDDEAKRSKGKHTPDWYLYPSGESPYLAEKKK